MPRYNDIKQGIKALISNGELTAGSQTPSENSLASQYNVSRMTARRALQELVYEGILFARKGFGTYVAEPSSRSAMLEIKSITDEIKNQGARYTNRILLLTSRPADKQTALALSVAEGSEVFFSMIVHQKDGIALELEQRAVNPELAPAYLKQDFSSFSPHEYLCGVAPLTEASHQIEAIAPTSSMCEWLKIDRDQPCLQVSRQMASDKGMVSYARLVYPGNRYHLGTALVTTE
ncbi:UTRA domain-containing protein [Corallincola platygyrae]|uniref:UTRA domain-containing protein n=1 Tax=Corallincola platygyrae TaxID=1193278 RepID=A0ABW4XLL9_9GAMM